MQKITPKTFNLSLSKNILNDSSKEHNLKNFLIGNGFYEVINNPFVSEFNKHSIEVDNPLDVNKKFLRTSLKESLINNLLFNERRQKDSVKLFEISDIYFLDGEIKQKKMLVKILI